MAGDLPPTALSPPLTPAKDAADLRDRHRRVDHRLPRSCLGRPEPHLHLRPELRPVHERVGRPQLGPHPRLRPRGYVAAPSLADLRPNDRDNRCTDPAQLHDRPVSPAVSPPRSSPGTARSGGCSSPPTSSARSPAPCCVCAAAARSATTGRCVAGLLLLAAGFTSSCVFWCVVLAFLLTRPAWLGALFPDNIGLTAWLMTAGAGLPLALTAYRTACDARAIWRLHPLWRDLVDAVPHVALDTPRNRIRAVLGRPHAIHLRLYRQVIEIRDVLLILQDYVTPETMKHARRHITTQTLPEQLSEPASTACWLQTAIQAKAAAATPRPNPLATVNHDCLRSETDFLLAVLKARRLPAVRSFAPPPTTSDPATPDRSHHHVPTAPLPLTNRRHS
ncbi:MAB_1171c family putative transporter [Streptomyces lasalocidi]